MKETFEITASIRWNCGATRKLKAIRKNYVREKSIGYQTICS